MRRARSDPDAFASLYRAHSPAIARYVRRRVGDPDLTDDLVAETFTVALEKLGGYRERGLPFRAWLYRLASTAIHRWVRRQRLRVTAAFDREPEAPEDESSAAVELARATLLRLPVRYQTALALHYLEGLSVAEIAAVSQCRPGTVKARLSRGRELLRERLRPHAKELFR